MKNQLKTITAQKTSLSLQQKLTGISVGAALFCLLLFGSQQLQSTQSLVSAVEYSYLQAAWDQAESSGVVLWGLSFEDHISHFEIERSLDEAEFQIIGKVEAEGEGKHADGRKYEFADQNLKKAQFPKASYRIRYYGMDGFSDYSEVFKPNQNLVEEK